MDFSRQEPWNGLPFPGGSVVKNPPAKAGERRFTGPSLGQKDPLGKEIAIYASILAWEIPWIKQPGG